MSASGLGHERCADGRATRRARGPATRAAAASRTGELAALILEGTEERAEDVVAA